MFKKIEAGVPNPDKGSEPITAGGQLEGAVPATKIEKKFGKVEPEDIEGEIKAIKEEAGLTDEAWNKLQQEKVRRFQEEQQLARVGQNVDAIRHHISDRREVADERTKNNGQIFDQANRSGYGMGNCSSFDLLKYTDAG